MTTRRMRHLLTLAWAVQTLACMGVVAWTLLNPPTPHRGQTTPATDLESAADRTPEHPSITPLPDRGALLTLAEKPLRQQLFDPPPPPPERPPPPPPLPGIELISTVLPANGEPSAWVREPAQGNTPRRIRIGDVLGTTENPATLTAIEPDRLLVEHNGEIKPIDRAPVTGGRRR